MFPDVKHFDPILDHFGWMTISTFDTEKRREGGE